VKLENVAFVPLEVVEKIHDEALSKGGAPGLMSQNLLVSAIETPKSTFGGRPLYPSLAEIAATYVWGLARNHPFVDGNKRTALLTALTFLDLNGRRIQVDRTWVELIVRVASDATLQRVELVDAFRLEMGGDEVVT
jgi:death-on-curing protein